MELDGELHQFQRQADAQRQSELESLGYRVIRFSNDRVPEDLQNVLEDIVTAAQVAPTPYPSPSVGGVRRDDQQVSPEGRDLEEGGEGHRGLWLLSHERDDNRDVRPDGGAAQAACARAEAALTPNPSPKWRGAYDVRRAKCLAVRDMA